MAKSQPAKTRIARAPDATPPDVIRADFRVHADQHPLLHKWMWENPYRWQVLMRQAMERVLEAGQGARVVESARMVSDPIVRIASTSGTSVPRPAAATNEPATPPASIRPIQPTTPKSAQEELIEAPEASAAVTRSEPEESSAPRTMISSTPAATPPQSNTQEGEEESETERLKRVARSVLLQNDF